MDINNVINNLIEKRLYILADIVMEMYYIKGEINNELIDSISKLHNVDYMFKIASNINDDNAKKILIESSNSIKDKIINIIFNNKDYKKILDSYLDVISDNIIVNAENKNKYINKFDYYLQKKDDKNNKDEDKNDNTIKEKSEKIKKEYEEFLEKEEKDLSHTTPAKNYFNYYALYPYLYPFFDIPEYGYWYTYMI